MVYLRRQREYTTYIATSFKGPNNLCSILTRGSVECELRLTHRLAKVHSDKCTFPNRSEDAFRLGSHTSREESRKNVDIYKKGVDTEATTAQVVAKGVAHHTQW